MALDGTGDRSKVRRPWRRLAGIAVIVAVVIIVGYVALAMPGMDHSPTAPRMSDMDD